MPPQPIPYDPELAEMICDRLAVSTVGLEAVLNEMASEGIITPGLTTIYKWREQQPTFAESSARAMQLRADTLVDRAIEEANRSRVGEIRTEKVDDKGSTVEIKVADNVERSKLVVQTLLRRAGQLSPKKYAERINQAVTDGDGGPLVFQLRKVREEKA